MRITAVHIETPDGLTYQIEKLVLPPVLSRRLSPKELESTLLEVAVSKFKGKVTNQSEVKLGGFSGKEYAIDSPDGLTCVRVVVPGVRAFFIFASGPKDVMAQTDTANFLNSCKFPGKFGPGKFGPMKSGSDPVVGTEPAIGTGTNPTPSGSDLDMQATRLMEELIKATGTRRMEVINTLRDSKGAVYTEALKLAAGKLTGADQLQVREALARRLTRMTATTLRNMLADENREIRQAAATACGLKADNQFVPDLVDLLTDKDALVVEAAHTSLKSLTGKDFGPAPNATSSDKTRAIFAWRNWLKTQK